MKLAQKFNAAFSLIEVTLALGVAGFCLIALFGLLPVAVNSNRSSSEETTAVNILSSVAADLRQTPNPLPKGTTAQTSLVFSIPVPASQAGASASYPTNPTFTTYLSESGDPVAQSSLNSRFRLSVWSVPGVGRKATLMRIVVSWPASASLDNATGALESIVALDRN